MTLDQMLIRASEVTRRILEAGVSEPLPAWVAQNAAGQMLPILSPSFETEADLIATIEGVRTVFQQFGAIRYVSALHGWVLEGRAARDYQGGEVKDHPDGREVVSFVAVDVDGTTRAGHCYVLRPEHGKPSLSPLKELPACAARGALTELLKPAPSQSPPRDMTWGNTTRH